MNGFEPVVARRYIYGVLSADATLLSLLGGSARIYEYKAPQGTASPWIVFNSQSNQDDTTANQTRVLTSFLFQIKAVGQTASMASLEAIAARIDTLLQRTRGLVTNGNVRECYREQAVDYSEDINGLEYRHLGGIYRLNVQAT